MLNHQTVTFRRLPINRRDSCRSRIGTADLSISISRSQLIIFPDDHALTIVAANARCVTLSRSLPHQGVVHLHAALAAMVDAIKHRPFVIVAVYTAFRTAFAIKI